ncbi:LuxR C-terminal-related transcriptional regulator [Fusibacter bizertensis]|uniref:LuxR C-terminal-related transcriptional regulator n=1 Tax=Fusibacter bizertensis TaxID=1488331 RepID=A0ABT6NF87_9FIRM|nr:LuxR C-terminal-related transcriptional regulator [Fusibacter bizertensis]MDH8679030.1 LuxR C-terminal-related transcriptional regulator [Fusibacter bizertensis]
MNTWFYENKLSKPQLPLNWIKRKKVLRKLDENPVYDVIQVVSPAGSGKSILISHWVSEKEYPHLWYSLDPTDNDLIRFYNYLLRGLVSSEIISEEEYLGVLKMFNHSEYNMSAFLLSQFLNIKYDFYLIFDDFHSLNNNDIFIFLNRLLSLKNQYLKIVVISREEQHFPPITKVLEGFVTQIGLSDLALSKKEIQSYLNMLSPKTSDFQLVESIYSQTEGWLFGVQLMSSFVVKGETIHNELKSKQIASIKQYMIDEILLFEDQSIIDFVYRTSVLDFFNISICEKIMDDTKLSIESILVKLKKKNLFLVELEKENTYRYHHLFKEALDITRQQYFETQSMVNLQSIILIIADWYEQHDMFLDAINQYIQIKAYSKAVQLLSEIWPDVDVKMEHKSWRELVEKLPLETYSDNPIIYLGLGWSLLQDGNIKLAQAKFNLSFDIYTQCNYLAYPEITQTIPLSCKIAEIYIASMNNQHDGTLDIVHKIFNEYESISIQYVGVIYTLQSCAYWAQGEFLLAEQSLIKSKEYLKDDLVYNLVDLTLIELYCEFGYFRKAEFLLNLVSSRVDKNSILKILNASLDLFRGKLFFYKGDLELAYEKLRLSEESGSICALDDWKYKMLKLKARMLISQDMYEEAYETIAQLRMVINPSPIPEYLTTLDLEEAMRLRQTKETGLVLSHIHENELSSFITEYATILLVLSALYKIKANDKDKLNLAYIKAFLVRNIKHFEQQKRVSSMVTFNLLLSICYHYEKNDIKRLEFYKLSKKYANLEGYQLPFILYSIENIIENIPISRGSLIYSNSNNGLIEPLSKRELDVFLCISEGLTNKEISGKLYLSEETIKSYNKSIYRKLGVNRRTQAIVKAKELGFLK